MIQVLATEARLERQFVEVEFLITHIVQGLAQRPVRPVVFGISDMACPRRGD